MYKRILVATDGSRAARLALDEAIPIAQAFGARVMAVSVVEHQCHPIEVGAIYAPAQGLSDAQSEAAAVALDEARKLFAAKQVEGSVSAVDAYGESVASALASVAGEWKADLIVMGTRGRHGLRRAILGSVADSVLRTVSVPVLLVRHNPDKARRWRRALRPLNSTFGRHTADSRA